MIDARRAVQIAKTESEEVLDWAAPKLEEIERELYQGHDSWSVTLSTPRPIIGAGLAIPSLRDLTQLSEYKRFLIDTETGELLAVKMREFSGRGV